MFWLKVRLSIRPRFLRVFFPAERVLNERREEYATKVYCRSLEWVDEPQQRSWNAVDSP